MDKLAAEKRATEKQETLYPPLAPYDTGFLQVSKRHKIYYEQAGNPDGQPVIILHGGPGGGITPVMRRFHDPDHYRIILFDQRGCGRSTPYASLEENTTWDLVADIEKLRQHLRVDRWQVFGGSWGSSLALAYAERHPSAVTALILRGIFTLRRAELLWFYQEGCSWIFPDAFEAYQAPIPQAERGDMIAAYYRRLTGDDEAEKLRAARAWSAWEGTTLSLREDPERVANFTEDRYALAFARIECHYFINRGFFEKDGQLILDAVKIADIPGVIVHGRYDIITPLKNAWDLNKIWTRGELRIVPEAGHAVTEPGIIHELITATKSFAHVTR